MKNETVIAILTLLLIGTVGYIIYDDNQEQESIKVQNATLNGYNLARAEIIQRTAQCQSYPIEFTNGTVNYRVTLVAMECLQQRGAGA